MITESRVTTAIASSRNPTAGQSPISGSSKSRTNSDPKPSITVSPSRMKPQKVMKCVMPAPDHLSSRRWPSTSTSSVFSAAPTSRARVGSTGCPAVATR